MLRGPRSAQRPDVGERTEQPRQLRRALLGLRDQHLLGAYLSGHESIVEDLVFPSESGTLLDGSNLYTRYFLPAIERTGLRHFRIHDLRHTFATQLIQDGASLPYVRDQLGHSSIAVTVDLYGHLVPSANIAWVDRLDAKTTPQQNATPTQLEGGWESSDSQEVLERNGSPGVSRTPDLRFRKPLLYPSELRGHYEVTSLCHVSLPKSEPVEFSALVSPGCRIAFWSGGAEISYGVSSNTVPLPYPYRTGVRQSLHAVSCGSRQSPVV